MLAYLYSILLKIFILWEKIISKKDKNKKLSDLLKPDNFYSPELIYLFDNFSFNN